MKKPLGLNRPRGEFFLTCKPLDFLIIKAFRLFVIKLLSRDCYQTIVLFPSLLILYLFHLKIHQIRCYAFKVNVILFCYNHILPITHIFYISYANHASDT